MAFRVINMLQLLLRNRKGMKIVSQSLRPEDMHISTQTAFMVDRLTGNQQSAEGEMEFYHGGLLSA